MIHGAARFVLPLMYHLVQQRLNRLVPSVPPDVTPADDNLGAMPQLTAQRVMTKPRFHSPRYADRDRAQLAAKLRCIEGSMRMRQLADEAGIIRATAAARTRRIEIK